MNNNMNLSTEENRAKKIKICHRLHGTKEGQVPRVGEGDTGQLSLCPDVLERNKPEKVDLPPSTVQVCAGGMHSVCLTSEGKVFTWGCNDEGALGRGRGREDVAGGSRAAGVSRRQSQRSGHRRRPSLCLGDL